MRPHLREFFELCARTIVCPEPIVEIGLFQVRGQEELANLRPLFPGKVYIGCDMQPGNGVDRIEDIHQLSFGSGEVGTFILADTLEYVLDPFLAMREIRRCLRSDGIAIYASVMNFPIHGYPNDYWRFTPEAFRLLGSSFARATILFCGPADHPHTVCGIATGENYDISSLAALAKRVRNIKTTAPLILEPRAAKIIRRLAAKLIPQSIPVRTQKNAGFDTLAEPGWCLVTGQWLAGWVAIDNVHEIEIRAAGKVFHRAKLNRPRPEVATALKLPNTNAAIGFCDQVDLSAIGDYTGTLEMTTFGADKEPIVVCESAPGVALGSLSLEKEFLVHSVDERLIEESRSKARKLIDAIRQRGEPVNVDLGCGFRKNGNVGIDVTPRGTEADVICRIGFEPIPLDDEAADTVYCRDFLEHIPKGYYSEHDQILRYPVIEVMNEVWRILKPGGTFTSFTPCYPAVEVHRDPTHLSVWTLESMQYFCGKYPIAKIYGVRANFEILVNRLDGFYLHAVLRKPLSP
jgi:SAM-dependent methyltransferase